MRYRKKAHMGFLGGSGLNVSFLFRDMADIRVEKHHSFKGFSPYKYELKTLHIQCDLYFEPKNQSERQIDI